MNPLKYVPNLLTTFNLLSGCLALLMLAIGDPLIAAFLVLAAAVFDFFDGFAARALKVSTPIGGDLDSLADMVTFGVVPGMMLLYYLLETTGHSLLGLATFIEHPILILPLAIPVFSALRLAKFNVDTRQTDSFRGVPTPASALWVISIPLILHFSPTCFGSDVTDAITGEWFLVVSAVVLSLLMVSDIPLLAMKFKSFGWNGNEVRFVFLIISVVLLIILRPLAIPIILSLYVLISIVNNLFLKKDEVQS